MLQVVPTVPAEARCKLIGTHDGTFHIDEILAIAMLTQLSANNDSTIVRTRCPEQLAKCDFRVDVGGKDDPETGDFDHHQRGFARVMAKYNCSTKLSSAGLVYAAFGPEIIRTILDSDLEVYLVFASLFTLAQVVQWSHVFSPHCCGIRQSYRQETALQGKQQCHEE